MIVDAYLINWARWYFVRTTAPPTRSKTPTSTPGNLLKRLKLNSILLFKVNSSVKYLGSDVMYITRQWHFSLPISPPKNNYRKSNTHHILIRMFKNFKTLIFLSSPISCARAYYIKIGSGLKNYLIVQLSYYVKSTRFPYDVLSTENTRTLFEETSHCTSLRKQQTFRDATTGFPAKWRSTTNEKLYPDPGSDGLSVLNFCTCFSNVILRRNQWWRHEMWAFSQATTAQGKIIKTKAAFSL